MNELPFSSLGEGTWSFLAKLVGAVGGSAISIAYVLPRGRREAALRFATGIVAGMVFGNLIGLKLARHLALEDAMSSIEISMTGAAITSLTAWSALGAIHRLLKKYSPGQFRASRNPNRSGETE